MTAVEIARALPKCRKSGTGHLACCPAHQDDNPSLAITERDGKPLVHCHAGCSQDAVIDALKAVGLWPGRARPSDGDFEAVYNYTDERGNPLYQVIRKRGKKFLQRRPDGLRRMDLAQASATGAFPPPGNLGASNRFRL